MFTAEQYRARAVEYSQLVKIAKSPAEVSEFKRLERTFAELADNAQWAVDNYDKTLHATSGLTGASKSKADQSFGKRRLDLPPARNDTCSEDDVDNSTLLIVTIIPVLRVGGGGWYGRGRRV
jgi:hypothetical protein